MTSLTNTGEVFARRVRGETGGADIKRMKLPTRRVPVSSRFTQKWIVEQIAETQNTSVRRRDVLLQDDGSGRGTFAGELLHQGFPVIQTCNVFAASPFPSELPRSRRAPGKNDRGQLGLPNASPVIDMPGA